MMTITAETVKFFEQVALASVKELLNNPEKLAKTFKKGYLSERYYEYLMSSDEAILQFIRVYYSKFTVKGEWIVKNRHSKFITPYDFRQAEEFLVTACEFDFHQAQIKNATTVDSILKAIGRI
jgi:hypothetical protein